MKDDWSMENRRRRRRKETKTTNCELIVRKQTLLETMQNEKYL